MANKHDSFGYPSTDPCRICGGHFNNQMEPRFLYTVCQEHQGVPPAMIEQERLSYREAHNRQVDEQMNARLAAEGICPPKED